jgi:hypothetical protein
MVEGAERKEAVEGGSVASEVGRKPDLFFVKYLALGFALFILAVIITADLGIISPLLGWLTFHGGDKLGHFTLFGILSLLINLALFEAFPNRERKRVAVFAGLFLAALIAAEEVSQNLFSTRTFSWSDLAASWVGVAAFSVLSLRIGKARTM